ncbi:xylulokinase [Salibacterium salarium]|uniref:Xylulose kinase n=1 Tax=Salibacterium salarium TaxID=284579 RepID=A0A3R9QPE0_9BACI|nr:xylulokinase [Salibacterium salarium]RSL35344.1 xylulokinase [Salibacterium salarium]
MSYFIGIDLGTSAVKLLLVNEHGDVVNEVSKSYPLIQEKTGYSEQNPEDWVRQTIEGLSELVQTFTGNREDIKGMSFSGQMHGLVLLDENNEVLRHAILWNDTRTTKQCKQIYETMGEERVLEVTKNPALEGFTLPKLMWVQENEPAIFKKARRFVLPKDYVRYRLTGEIHMEYSDAAGTLLLDVLNWEWSEEMCDAFGIDRSLCPSLVESTTDIGSVTREITEQSGISKVTSVIAGGADNACGAVGSGILSEGKTFCSIGTSGVVLSYEKDGDKELGGNVHYFNHAVPDAYYTMGVTLSAGNSLRWFKDVFAEREDFDTMLADIETVPPGSKGLLFTPFLDGERTPHADASIRASFIGMDSSHERKDFARAVLEGITFSLCESIEIFRKSGKTVDTIVSIGGGAKNESWLQMQADVFNATVVKLKSEQGPAMGAAMLAAFGSGAFTSLQACANRFIREDKVFQPDPGRVETYKQLFRIYQDVYANTAALNQRLMTFRN